MYARLIALTSLVLMACSFSGPVEAHGGYHDGYHYKKSYKHHHGRGYHRPYYSDHRPFSRERFKRHRRIHHVRHRSRHHGHHYDPIFSVRYPDRFLYCPSHRAYYPLGDVYYD